MHYAAQVSSPTNFSSNVKVYTTKKSGGLYACLSRSHWDINAYFSNTICFALNPRAIPSPYQIMSPTRYTTYIHVSYSLNVSSNRTYIE